MDANSTTKSPMFFSVRFLVAFLSLLLTTVQYMQRVNLSVAIVCMVNNTALEIKRAKVWNFSQPETDSDCKIEHQNISASSSHLVGSFNWDKSLQGFILSTYFYGSLSTQILGALLSLRFGPKIVLLCSILASSAFTLLIPVLLELNLDYIGLIICRLLIGIFHGVVWPSMISIWPYWAPQSERSTLLGFSIAGSQLGNVFMLPLGGFLCNISWQSIFYITGALGFIWCLLWLILFSDKPSTHRFIGNSEKAYLMDQTKLSIQNFDTMKKRNIPIKSILTSAPFWAIVVAHTSSNFCLFFFQTQLPTYMSEVLRFDIKSNGLFSALPFWFFWVMTILCGFVSDRITRTGKLSKTVTRKLFNSIGFFFSMINILLLIFVTCAHPYIGVALVTAGIAFSGFTHGAGFMISYNDIGDIICGYLLGISNTVSTVAGIISPFLAGYLTPNKTASEWKNVFITMASVYLVGGLVFLLFASGETQKWARDDDKSAEQHEIKKLNDIDQNVE